MQLQSQTEEPGRPRQLGLGVKVQSVVSNRECGRIIRQSACPHNCSAAAQHETDDDLSLLFNQAKQKRLRNVISKSRTCFSLGGHPHRRTQSADRAVGQSDIAAMRVGDVANDGKAEACP